MMNLFLRSVLVLALLFGLLFGVGMGVLTYFGAPLWIAAVLALVVLLLQYLLGPRILEFFYKIEWRDPMSVDLALADFIARVCADRNIPIPRFGVIHDGNPNAFTFGHYPGDARLVVTTGLIELLEDEERQAVVAHELGHIAHWDFVVMTVVAAVPLLLYILYRATWRRRGRGKSGAYAVAIGVVSYVAYIVSHYIVLLLSRVREYYADQFAGEVTGNPNALSSALVKIAYGLASASKNDKKDNSRLVAGQAFGIFDFKMAQSLALASAGRGSVSAETMESAMKWDMWNPWAIFYELGSSHPLPAKRIRALDRQSAAYDQPPRFSFQAQRPESYWDEFLVDLFISYLPALAFLVGLPLVAILVHHHFLAAAAGVELLLVSMAWWLKREFSYQCRFGNQLSIRSLISRVKVSAVRSIPCTLEGEIIGRGIPGLFYSEDLVLQDDSGFIVLDYRQPFRILEFLFGWLKADKLIGRRGKVIGWYRRSPRPYFEMWKLELENGETVTSHYYPVTQFLVCAAVVLGIVLLGLEALPVF